MESNILATWWSVCFPSAKDALITEKITLLIAQKKKPSKKTAADPPENGHFLSPVWAVLLFRCFLHCQ